MGAENQPGKSPPAKRSRIVGSCGSSIRNNASPRSSSPSPQTAPGEHGGGGSSINQRSREEKNRAHRGDSPNPSDSDGRLACDSHCRRYPGGGIHGEIRVPSTLAPQLYLSFLSQIERHLLPGCAATIVRAALGSVVA
ncbi:unnamed protein product [Urochloa humidicola]